MLPKSNKQIHRYVGQRVLEAGHIPAPKFAPNAEAARTRQHHDQCALTTELGFLGEGFDLAAVKSSAPASLPYNAV
jgi:hypothetical protein